jgi:hypothetical protein
MSTKIAERNQKMNILRTAHRRGALTSALSIVALGVALLFVASHDGDNASSDAFFVEEVFAQPVASCTSPSADDGAFALNGTKLPVGGLTFKVNQNTFPAGLNPLEVHASIAGSFLTWDSATSKVLFTHGGTTNAMPGSSDGISTIAFKKIKGSAVAMTTGWFNRKTKLLTEFDVALNTNYSWATNLLASGDCGGAAGQFDIGNVMTHEAGHATGLSDVTPTASNAQTMFAYVAYGELTKRTPASGDLKGLAAIYEDGNTQ